MIAELSIARRLRLTRGDAPGSRRSAIGVAIGITGVALAIVIMLATVAVMKGFRQEIRRKVIGFEAQLSLTLIPTQGYDIGDSNARLDAAPLSLSDTLAAIIAHEAPEATAVLTVSRPVLLKTTDNFQGLVMKAYPPEFDNEFIASHIVAGVMPDYATADSLRNHIVVSAATASALALEPGSRVPACFFSESGALKSRNLTVAGVYDTHFGDYDHTYAFCSMDMLQGVCGLNPDQATRIEIHGLTDDDTIDMTDARLNQALIEAYYSGTLSELYSIDNVHDRGAIYFNWLAMLDTNVIVILILMAVVAGFTLISSLFIIVLERVAMIGLLKALGASNAFVRRIFIAVAERLVIRGMIIGNAVGLALVTLQHQLHLLPLDPDTYYLNYVPAALSWIDVVWLNLGALAVSALVLVLPSQIVSSLSPSRTLRYE